MPTLDLTTQDLKSYRKGERRHIFYQRSVENAKEIEVHSEGEFPAALLMSRRPHEPLVVYEYRKLIYEAITKPAFTKVFSSLQKIRRSNDWAVDYGDKLEDFALVSDEESLENYCEKQFPYFTSVTNWVFNLALRKYMIDPNAVMLVMPINLQDSILADDQTVFPRPFPVIFSSALVLDYKEEDFCFLTNPSGSYYYDSRGNLKLGESYYFITTQKIQRYDQRDGNLNFDLALDYDHLLGYMPARKLGAVLIDQAEGQFFYESRIEGMMPELNEATRENSDLQAAVVLHTYPERWQYANMECPSCQGKTKIVNPNWSDGCDNCGTQWIECDRCNGTGVYVNNGPFSKILVRPNNGAVGESGNVPTPPAGFVEKDVEIVKLQDQRIADHFYKAYSSINFEFLADVPLSQSGKAKEVDKDELNNTVYSFAEDLVSLMDFLYKAVADYRYGFIYQYDYDKIDEMLPNIAVPVTFDLLGSTGVQAILANAKSANINPVILNALESEYASKMFYNDPKVRENLLLELNLDPLPNITESDKILRLSNKGIDQLTYVMSSNIHAFVQRAVETEADFAKQPIEKQKEIIEAYAQEMIDAASAKTAASVSLFNSAGNGLYLNDGGQLVTPESKDDPYLNNSPENNLLRTQQNFNNGIPSRNPGVY